MDTAFTFSFTLEFGNVFGVTGKGDFDGKCISVAANPFGLKIDGEREAAENYFSSHDIDWEILPLKDDDGIAIKVVEFRDEKCKSARDCNLFVQRVMMEVATKAHNLYKTGKLDANEPIDKDMLSKIINAVDTYVYELM